MHYDPDEHDAALAARLSIGALARATGVPAETLRTWERRYGFPVPSGRTPSGHRYYPLSAVEAVRLALRALDRGHRAAHVLRAEPATVRLLAGIEEPPVQAKVRALPQRAPDAPMQRWIVHCLAFEGEALTRDFEREWTRLGAIAFLDRAAAPFLKAIGEAWGAGEMQVAHEHFATEQLREFLTRHWRPLSDSSDFGVVVCATPPGERHVVGLHMAATVLALAGYGLVFLGADVPALDVAAAVRQTGASVVALSASAAFGDRAARTYLDEVTAACGDDIHLVAGGRGFAESVDVAERFEDFAALDVWARAFRQGFGRQRRTAD